MSLESAKHVDVLRNDWSDAVQRLVARVQLNGDLAVTDSADEKRWEEILLAPERKTETGEAINSSAGKDYLAILVRDYSRDTYYDVTDIHDADDCPVPDSGIIPMRPIKTP